VHPSLILFFLAAAGLRLLSLAISRRHERALLAQGAVEHGAATSRMLVVLHAGFYAGALVEALVGRSAPDGLTIAGVFLYVGGMTALALVIRELGSLWTVKLYLSPTHVLHQGGLFRSVRHPNYFLNMVPEVIGLALALRAWWTLGLLFPPYLLVLRRRIAQEEHAMQSRFPAY
jgi:isoprenylcysteine carboxyl methyltransferase (ICMT) family protein YpbQ